MKHSRNRPYSMACNVICFGVGYNKNRITNKVKDMGNFKSRDRPIPFRQ